MSSGQDPAWRLGPRAGLYTALAQGTTIALMMLVLGVSKEDTVRRALIGLAILVFTAASAQAVTLRDIVDLTKAGLGDDVLLALIDVDGGVFNVDTETLTQLKAAGVSEKVIVALVRSGRARLAVAEPPPQDLQNPEPASPQVVYVQQPATVVREVAVPVPVYVTVPVGVGSRRVHAHTVVDRSAVPPSISAPPGLQGPTTYQTDKPEPRQPEYWGNGGKLRPDAWKPR